MLIFSLMVDWIENYEIRCPHCVSINSSPYLLGSGKISTLIDNIWTNDLLVRKCDANTFDITDQFPILCSIFSNFTQKSVIRCFLDYSERYLDNLVSCLTPSMHRNQRSRLSQNDPLSTNPESQSEIRFEGPCQTRGLVDAGAKWASRR